MFYRPEAGHGLPHNPLNAIVAPRPIGWVSTRGHLGDNLAPYSFFNLTAYTPPQVMFASTSQKPDRPGTKDSVAQIAETRVFCVNIADGAMRDQVNASSAALPAGANEFETAGIEAAECETIDCPRVLRAAASLECRMTRIIRLAGEANVMVLGVVTGIHMREDCIVNGRFDLRRHGWLSRLGYKDYTATTETFEMERP
ncbi:MULTISPECIES: flavin reductase family protein [Paracoccus]|jgi:flavin reductase (DIM6/NTAB) family NADH-FMN oxidoreductase RutF|uniref:Flavin reductase family protein n=1 Tax=Paracoccus litorisediminis TaxID=2006130 RepID=A0A844HKS6_9RHOB|nr:MULTISPECIES: flavin reductase family protein [Paracoccus]MBD9526697.1 flavin reductase family protein [Paracoccus sp. PAR01]MTH59598.1 flavin reductase family protein [Paracoccus litorisediminis]